MAFIVVEHLFEGQELVMADERGQLDLELLRVEKRILLMEVGDRHLDLVHPEVFEKHWELFIGLKHLYFFGQF